MTSCPARSLLAACLSLAWLVACGGSTAEAPACAIDPDCDDSLLCTLDRCQDGACVHEPRPSYCDDHNPCTRDACHPTQGCLNAADRQGEACDDGDPCTVETVCDQGACTGQRVSCDDGDPCTDDDCGPTGECEYQPAPDGRQCQDADPCTGGETCQGGACVGGSETCECREDAQCAGLEDGDLCNGRLTCQEHLCLVDPDSVKECDTSADGPCGRAVCRKADGECEFLALHAGQPCQPLALCAAAGVCSDGICLPTADKDCDDGQPCTTDSCEAATGECVHEPLAPGEPCDDGVACTLGTTCDAQGGCGKPLGDDCDDGNPCTDDFCDPAGGGGCIHENSPMDSPCETDADPCTSKGRCLSAKCYYQDPVPGCCNLDGECTEKPPRCKVARCLNHGCSFDWVAECCGNGVVESDEECDTATELGSGLCGDACRWSGFSLGAGTGDASSLAAAQDPASRNTLVAWVAGSETQRALQFQVIGPGGALLTAPKVIVSGAHLAWPAVTSLNGEAFLLAWFEDFDLGLATIRQAGGDQLDFVASESLKIPFGFSGPIATDSQTMYGYRPLAVGGGTSGLLVTHAVFMLVDGDLGLEAGTLQVTRVGVDPQTGQVTAGPLNTLDSIPEGFFALAPSVVGTDLAYLALHRHTSRGVFDYQVRWARFDATGTQPVADRAVAAREVGSGWLFMPTAAAYGEAAVVLWGEPDLDGEPVPVRWMRLLGGEPADWHQPVRLLPELQSVFSFNLPLDLGDGRLAVVHDEFLSSSVGPSGTRPVLDYAVVDAHGQTLVPDTGLGAPPDAWQLEPVVVPFGQGGFLALVLQVVDGVGTIQGRVIAP